jgi:hypothetical protein
MIVTRSTSCHRVRMKIGPYIGCAVLVMVFGSAILGMLIRRKLPESHLSDEAKGVVTLSMGVVGDFDGLSPQPVDRHGKWYFQYQESADHGDSR